MVDLSKMTNGIWVNYLISLYYQKQSTEADIRRGCQIAKEYNCKAF